MTKAVDLGHKATKQTKNIVAVSSDWQTADQSLLWLPMQLILKSCKLVIILLLKKIQFSGRKYLI